MWIGSAPIYTRTSGRVHCRHINVKRHCVRQHGRLAADLPHHIFVILAVRDPSGTLPEYCWNFDEYLNKIYEDLWISSERLSVPNCFRSWLASDGLQQNTTKQGAFIMVVFGIQQYSTCEVAAMQQVIWVALMGYFIFGVVGAMWHESRILQRALLKASSDHSGCPSQLTNWFRVPGIRSVIQACEMIQMGYCHIS